MGILPVSVERYFADWKSDVLIYDVIRDGTSVAKLEGLSNEDEFGEYIGFFYGSAVQIGDILENSDSFTVRDIKIDHFQNEPQLLKAYY